MKILYGVNGEGLGHATRSRVVARHLIEQGHEVKIAASGPRVSVSQPVLRRRGGDLGPRVRARARAGRSSGGRSPRTCARAVAAFPRTGAAAWRRPSASAPELVVTDFEAFSYLYAKTPSHPRDLGRQHPDGGSLPPRASVLRRATGADYLAARSLRRRQALARQPLHHHDLLLAAHAQACAPRWCRRSCETRCWRRLPSRATTCSCTAASARPPIAALKAARRAGPHLRRARRRDRRQRDGNLLYRPFANEAFIDDLRTSRGVVASAGYSLMSEAVYLRKPMLALPLAGQFEQEMNARYLASLGYGTASISARRAGARAVPGAASRS